MNLLIVVRTVRVAEEAPAAGGGIWLLPAHVIFHSLRAISSTAPPPRSRLRLIMYLSLFISRPSIRRFLLNFYFFLLFSTLLPLPPPPHPTPRYCNMMHSGARHLNTIDSSLSLKVRKAPQAPVRLFPLAANSKWAGSHARTPLIYTANSNAQIIHSLHCKEWDGGGEKEGGPEKEREAALSASYFRLKLHTQDLNVQPRPWHL